MKLALSSKGAFKQLTGANDWDEIEWCYAALTPDEQEHCRDFEKKMRLRKGKGRYLIAFYVIQGKGRQDIMKSYGAQIKKITKGMAKKLGVKKDGSEGSGEGTEEVQEA